MNTPFSKNFLAGARPMWPTQRYFRILFPKRNYLGLRFDRRFDPGRSSRHTTPCHQKNVVIVIVVVIFSWTVLLICFGVHVQEANFRYTTMLRSSNPEYTVFFFYTLAPGRFDLHNDTFKTCSPNKVIWVSFSTGGSTQDEIVGTQPPLPPEETWLLFLSKHFCSCFSKFMFRKSISGTQGCIEA